MNIRTAPTPLWPPLLGLLLLASAATAENVALLVGVGEYPNLNETLPGIDQDLTLMRSFARRLGFGPRQIKVLRDRDATLADLEAAFEHWLVARSNPGDRVLIYFSGHGSRVPDLDGDEQDDHYDEVLLLHDARVVQSRGQPSLTGVLLDDRFRYWLHRIRSRNVLVLLDACHSGSATKFLTSTHGKFYAYGRIPRSGSWPFLTEVEGSTEYNYAALAAADDDEQALPSPQGSYFTRALAAAAKTAAHQHRSMTLRQLRDAAANYIRSHLPLGQQYTPTLSGNLRLAGVPLRFQEPGE